MKVIIGSAGKKQDGFVSTEKSSLDLLNPDSFAWLGNAVEVFFAEHVWEHLTLEQGFLAAVNCYSHLVIGGTLRIAVPDRLHPDPSYREWVRPGGTGPGAKDHKSEYDHITLSSMLLRASFSFIRILEWWDEHGKFHRNKWSPDFGFVSRSSLFDPRNKNHPLAYTSLIVDAMKGD